MNVIPSAQRMARLGERGVIYVNTLWLWDIEPGKSHLCTSLQLDTNMIRDKKMIFSLSWDNGIKQIQEKMDFLGIRRWYLLLSYNYQHVWSMCFKYVHLFSSALLTCCSTEGRWQTLTNSLKRKSWQLPPTYCCFTTSTLWPAHAYI